MKKPSLHHRVYKFVGTKIANLIYSFGSKNKLSYISYMPWLFDNLDRIQNEYAADLLNTKKEDLERTKAILDQLGYSLTKEEIVACLVAERNAYDWMLYERAPTDLQDEYVSDIIHDVGEEPENEQ